MPRPMPFVLPLLLLYTTGALNLAHAQKKTTAVTGNAAQVTALPATHIQQMAAGFSSDREKITLSGGEPIYRALCQSCHMSDGKGAHVVGFYPPLAANDKLTAAAYPVGVVLNGLHGMPGFAPQLDNQQVADVVNFIRSNFGNHFTDAIQADDVQPMRR